jgi:peptidoglycan-associated lipoprotein
MILKTRIKLAVLVLAMGFGLANCADEKKAEEAVTPTATETPAAPAPTAGVEEATAPIYFAYDDYTLDSSAQSSLNKLADYLKGAQTAAVQIEGHCDERGSIEYNLALGQRRAQSVKTYLSQLGVEDSRLSTISYGEEKPAADGHDEAAWSKNRRAQFVLSNP